MANSSPTANHVKKETMLLVAAACLLIGFLGGIVFSVFKLNTGGETVTATKTQQEAPQQPQMSAEQASKALALERDLAANPKNTKAWIDLGDLYFDTSEPQKAIRAYTKALDLEPNNPTVLTDLGVMYRRSGKFDKALQSFDKAISLNPSLPQPRFNKGIVLLFDLNREKEAMQTWEDLLKVDPNATAPNGQPLREVIQFYQKQLKQQQGRQQAPQPAAAGKSK
ncbi:MAG: tetratricopeptide repeat protein [Deltaproteobacteria bacterium]|jgi:cytochrome c-type biogenesis protein CcmH/NrfG